MKKDKYIGVYLENLYYIIDENTNKIVWTIDKYTGFSRGQTLPSEADSSAYVDRKPIEFSEIIKMRLSGEKFYE